MLRVRILNVQRDRSTSQLFQKRTIQLAQAFASRSQFLANTSSQLATHAMPDEKVRQQSAFGEFDSKRHV